MKVFDPETKNYRKTRRITDKLPVLMAAVYLYTNRRTTLLALDFDTSRGGQEQVDRDSRRAAAWLRSCGARIIADQSTHGGRHLLVPLAIGTSAGFDEIQALMRQLALRLPSLDPKPMQNAKEGCISVPGSPCAGGGHRRLEGTAAEALAALTERSDPTLLPALYALLGSVPAPSQPAAVTPPCVEGAAEDAHLAAHVCWTKPMPPDVLDFADRGDAALGPVQGRRHSRWQSPSEARMSLVLNAVLRGHSLAALRERMSPGGDWAGAGHSYTHKYGSHADAALARDVAKALTYTSTLAQETNPSAHRSRNSHRAVRSMDDPYTAWLAHAQAWADREFAGKPSRWTVRDVLQALANKAALIGDIRAGTPIVGVGGRGVSLSAGLLSATATFETLRQLRDMVGAPIVLVRRHVGRDADFYALTTHGPEPVTPVPAHRVRIEDVHPMWGVLGRHHRLIYELIIHTGLSVPADVYAAAHVSPRSGQLSVATLVTAGLITRVRGRLRPGPVTLDDLAASHRLADTQAERIARYRRERAVWHDWLALHERLITAGRPADPARVADLLAAEALHRDEYLASVLATGPPDESGAPDPTHQAAVELVRDLIGARIVATATTTR